MNDPNSWLEGAFEELKHTVLDKNEDYRINGEFSNFEFASAVSGVDVLDGLMNQIGIKIGRIKGIWEKDRANNEPLIDSYKDLAGYALIMFAYALKTIDDHIDIEYPEGPEW